MSGAKTSRTKRVPRANTIRSIEMQIRGEVAGGAWAAGEVMPSRRDLALRFGVDLNLIQRSLAPLLADGTLRADPGRGTFIPESSASDAGITGRRYDINEHSGPRVDNRTLGIIWWDADDPTRRQPSFASPLMIMRSIENDFCAGGGIVRSSNGMSGVHYRPFRDVVDELTSFRCDTIAIVNLFDTPAIRDLATEFRQTMSCPIAYVSSLGGEFAFPHVFWDQRHAGSIAAEHLIGCGCDTLAFISPFADSWIEDRLAGVKDAAARRNLATSAVEQFPQPFSGDQYALDSDVRNRTIVESAIAHNLMRSGVIVPNDITAFQVMEITRQFDIEAGRDYALIGFDDEARSVERGLSTIRPPHDAMGLEASRLLRHQVNGVQVTSSVCLQATLVARASTALQKS